MLTQKPILRTISFCLALIATILLTLDLTHVIMITKTERGLWDFLSPPLINAMFIAYPILLFFSLFFFVLDKHLKDKLISATKFLFFLNGVMLLIFTIVLISF
ncbi:MAG: hypothetical protein ABIN67_02840 [Ferruginibacter sp.]